MRIKHSLASLRTVLLPALLAALTFALLSAGEARAFSGTQLWSVSAGSSDQQSGETVAVDAAGNLYVAGVFENTIDLGGGTLTSAGGNDIFVAKYDVFGFHVWSASYGSAGDQLVLDSAIDPGGNLLLTGSFGGSVDFGGGALLSNGGFTDIFVAKLDSDGDHLWSASYGDSSTQDGLAVATDTTGNVIIAGGFAGTVDFGGGPLTADLYDVYVAKFDSAGVHVWSEQFGDGGTQSALAASVDPSGNVLLVGQFDLGIDLGGGPLADADGTANSVSDIFVAKLDATGAHVWSKRFGDGDDQAATAVAADNLGNVILSGTFQSSLDFGGGPLTFGSGANDIFLAKLDAAGNHVWSKNFFATLGVGHDVAADASNNIVLTGYYAVGQANFGGGAFPQVLNTDAFLAKFDPAGNHTWSKRFLGYEDSDLGNGVTTGPGNHVYLAGSFASEAFFGKFDGAAPTDGDGDGCTDAEELGHTTILGGNRDPLSPWDFYDVDGTKKIDSIDVGRVRSKFNQNYPPYDRSPGVHPAAPGPPDGIVDSIDIGLVRASFLHSCQALPN